MLSMNKIMAGIKCPESDNEEFGENFHWNTLTTRVLETFCLKTNIFSGIKAAIYIPHSHIRFYVTY